MINIPLIVNDPTRNYTYSQLGDEFKKMYELDRDRGFIDPPMNRNAPANFNAMSEELYIDGIPNQLAIFENNYDLSDNQILSNIQAHQILDSVSINRPYTDEEKLMSVLQEHDLDPVIRSKLVQESTAAKDNIYAQESQDFVKELQKDLAAFNREKNLYNLLTDPTERITSQLKEKLTKVDGTKQAVTDQGQMIKTLTEILKRGRKGLNPEDILNEVRKIIESPIVEKEEAEALRKITRQEIMKQRAGIKDFDVSAEERLVTPEKLKMKV
jgi:hypothetical protein